MLAIRDAGVLDFFVHSFFFLVLFFSLSSDRPAPLIFLLSSMLYLVCLFSRFAFLFPARLPAILFFLFPGFYGASRCGYKVLLVFFISPCIDPMMRKL